MKNIIDYLKESGDEKMDERAFCDVDSLILSQFSYLKFDEIVPSVGNERAVSLREIEAHPEFEKLFSDERYAKDNRALFDAMRKSKRFGRMKVNFHVNIIDSAWELQFSATTCLLENGPVYVVFRGTDETLVGWKEDFNMAFITPIPAQEKALQYLNCVTDLFAGKFIVGGHSKGGNLAVYASMHCKESAKDRILRIYSHDGPGFREEIFQSEEYASVRDRIHKLLPHSSMVGMLLQQQEAYEVVDCKSVGLLQHDPFNWLIDGYDFKRTDRLGIGAKIMDEGLNQWVSSLNQEQLQGFVETLYGVVEAANIKTLLDLNADRRKHANAIITAIKDMDDESKEILKQVVKVLFQQMKETLKKESSLPVKVPGLEALGIHKADIILREGAEK